MEKGKVKIESLDYEGFGVARIDGIPIFIENAIDSEIVEYKVTSKKKNVMFGKTTKIIEKSKDRVDALCKYYFLCGGCGLMHINYERQLLFKKEIVKNTFNHVGGFDCKINDCIGMENPYQYRNKIEVPFQNDCAGFYKKNTHEVVDMESCLSEPSISFEIINYLKELFKKYKISSYDDKLKKGTIRHVVIKNSFKLKEIMVIFVTNSKSIINKELIEELIKRFKDIKSVIQNINTFNTRVILGEKEYLLYGRDYIVDRIYDLDFKISSKSFFQVNSIQMEKLYEVAIKYALFDKENVVIDAYSGIGSISLAISKYVKHVYAIEVVEEAVKNALENKEMNKINNVDFILGKCEDKIKEIVSNKKIDVIIFDPPRKGCEKSFLDSVIESKIKRIVYISCNIRTQARDIKYLLENGYDVFEATPVDMFPNTPHIETICYLELKK